MKRIALLFAFVLFSLASSVAQKYGHLNFGNLIADMPQTEQANKDLETYQKQLVAKGEEMATKLQTQFEATLKEVNEGKLSPLQQQQAEADLQNQQNEIRAYEQEVLQKVEIKRQELLKPIIEKAEQAITQVAQENGYIMIFDTSVFNAILFAEDSDDVMSLVKAKLGIQ